MNQWTKKEIQGFNDRGFDKKVMKLVHDHWRKNIKVTIELIEPEPKEEGNPEEIEQEEKMPNSYMDCARGMEGHCYYKDNHILRYPYCIECVIDKSIWGDKAFTLRIKTKE